MFPLFKVHHKESKQRLNLQKIIKFPMITNRLYQIPKLYRVSQKSYTVYVIGIVVRYYNTLCNVITKCFQYEDQFHSSRD